MKEKFPPANVSSHFSHSQLFEKEIYLKKKQFVKSYRPKAQVGRLASVSLEFGFLSLWFFPSHLYSAS
jgi:hypothetical protein